MNIKNNIGGGCQFFYLSISYNLR